MGRLSAANVPTTTAAAITPALITPGGHMVRYVILDGTPWVVFTDLASPAGVQNIRDRLADVEDEAHRGVVSIYTGDGIRAVTIVTPVAAIFVLARGRSEDSKHLAWRMARLWRHDLLGAEKGAPGTAGIVHRTMNAIFGDITDLNRHSAALIARRATVEELGPDGLTEAGAARFLAGAGPTRVRARATTGIALTQPTPTIAGSPAPPAIAGSCPPEAQTGRGLRSPPRPFPSNPPRSEEEADAFAYFPQPLLAEIDALETATAVDLYLSPALRSSPLANLGGNDRQAPPAAAS